MSSGAMAILVAAAPGEQVELALKSRRALELDGLRGCRDDL